MNATIEINEENFDAEVLQSAQPVLVDFSAEWCGPCKMIAPILDQVAAEFNGRLKVVKIDVDQQPALAQRYRIQSLPTLLYLVKGEVQNQTVGAASKKAIVTNVESVLAVRNRS